tara:strand:- start:5013 stop:5360 length:348 start_codon:yes stop_codon:yes gene_type:complete
MDDKSEMINIIKRWMDIDRKLKVIQKQSQELKKEKKILTESLTNIMKDNDIDEFDINNGKLVYTRSKVRAPLSKKHLLESLNKYYKNDETLVEQLTTFIMESRQETVKDVIKHKE